MRSLEREEPSQQWAVLCFLAGRDVEIDEAELNASRRRSELLLATGGDPRRALELYGRAVTALARDLDTPERRRSLDAGLAALEAEAAGLRGAREAVRLLRRDPDLAWQAFAMSLLAEALAEE